MLVQYTSISSLNQNEFQALKSAVTNGIQLEGKQYIEFMGKTFSVSELMNAKRVWEQQRQSLGRQQLNG